LEVERRAERTQTFYRLFSAAAEDQPGRHSLWEKRSTGRGGWHALFLSLPLTSHSVTQSFIMCMGVMQGMHACCWGFSYRNGDRPTVMDPINESGREVNNRHAVCSKHKQPGGVGQGFERCGKRKGEEGGGGGVCWSWGGG
jgi:hypothetical protein